MYGLGYLFVRILFPFSRESIQFSMLSGTEVLKVSEVQVSRALFYNETRKPFAGGLLDPRMVMSHFRICHFLYYYCECCLLFFSCLRLQELEFQSPDIGKTNCSSGQA